MEFALSFFRLLLISSFSFLSFVSWISGLSFLLPFLPFLKLGTPVSIVLFAAWGVFTMTSGRISYRLGGGRQCFSTYAEGKGSGSVKKAGKKKARFHSALIDFVSGTSWG